jgi:DNA adenine methylase
MGVNQLKSPLKWIGGKSASAERIVATFPDSSAYDRYVEVCGGAAHVLMCKPPYDHEEVYNDLDDNLVTFWQQMQKDARALQERLEGLPYARKVYYEFYRSLFDGTELESLERAARWFYCLRSTGTGWLRKSPVGWNPLISNVKSFHSAIEVFQIVQERFQDIAIDNRDVLVSIKRYDTPKTLFYIDPPYFGTEYYYEPSKKGFPHETLANLLQSIQGYAVVSYYPHPSLELWYPESKWHRITWEQLKHSQVQCETRPELDIATEMLLTNYRPAERRISTQQNLWSTSGSEATA